MFAFNQKRWIIINDYYLSMDAKRMKTNLCFVLSFLFKWIFAKSCMLFEVIKYINGQMWFIWQKPNWTRSIGWYGKIKWLMTHLCVCWKWKKYSPITQLNVGSSHLMLHDDWIVNYTFEKKAKTNSIQQLFSQLKKITIITFLPFYNRIAHRYGYSVGWPPNRILIVIQLTVLNVLKAIMCFCTRYNRRLINFRWIRWISDEYFSLALHLA